MGKAFIYCSFQPYFCFFENKFTDGSIWIFWGWILPCVEKIGFLLQWLIGISIFYIIVG
jgi:hypothetical protein